MSEEQAQDVARLLVRQMLQRNIEKLENDVQQAQDALLPIAANLHAMTQPPLPGWAPFPEQDAFVQSQQRLFAECQHKALVLLECCALLSQLLGTLQYPAKGVSNAE